MHNSFPALLGALLLSILAGCTGMDTLPLVQDRPEDLEQLLEQQEYARARQLTGKHLTLDTPQVQQMITLQESAYVNATYADARTLESNQDLIGAVQLLSGALQRVPHSALLRELRNSLEQERIHQLKINERKQLIARASFMIDQQQLYRQQTNLEQPSLSQRWEHSRSEKSAVAISRQLFELGDYAFQQDDLENAQTCLDLSLALHTIPEARSLLTEVVAAKNSQHKLAQQKESIRQVRKQQKVQEKQHQETKGLLAETQQALDNNDLQVARSAFVRIPPSASNHSAVKSVQNNLDQAVNTQVVRLIATGDAQYRADKVNAAIRTWEEAHTLDPDNPELKQRIERAKKVLARLDELKSRQHK